MEEQRVYLKIDRFVRMDEIAVLRAQFEESGVIPNGCSEVLALHLFALVEYPDGTTGCANREQIRFLDGEDDL